MGEQDTAVTIEAIREARTAIAPSIRLTPVWPSITLERITGVPVVLKCEQMQLTGSFKIRGALNFVRRLSSGASRGLVAASAGNHAQGVALAGTTAGLPVVVVMPSFAPLAKATAAHGYGARVILKGNSLEEARAEAIAIAEREDLTFVPPFDDDDIIAGQGTIALELLEQVPDVEEILVPAGGGGLLAGVAVAVKSLRPDVRVIGVQSSAMHGIVSSLEAHSPVTVPPTRTIADGVAVAGPSRRTFELIERYVDDVVSCSDDQVSRAIVMLIERSKMVVEGAGALGAAALQAKVYRPHGKCAVILSGGNLDINLLGSIVRQGLVDAGRYQHLAVEVSDTPGELALVSRVIAATGGNIIEVDHNREARGMPVGVAVLDLLLEVNGPEHFETIIQALRDEGLRGLPGSAARLATEGARRRHEG
ncbi:MAG TPA: threonine ammonia-lyase [Tepidiformaceae bacterium]|nr:threonine ammonia-lyase [Tepidiformaceae bacterium]